MSALDEATEEWVTDVLAPLGRDQRDELVAAMAATTRLLRAAAVDVVEVDPEDPRVLVAQQAYVDELAETFDAGFQPGDLGEELPRYRAPDGSVLLALLDGEVLGTVALAPLTPRDEHDDVVTPLREVKRMWVAPGARGMGLGRRLLAAIEERAAALGTATLRLDTNETLGPAIALYESAGYRPVPRYNDNPYATHFMQRALPPGLTREGP